MKKIGSLCLLLALNSIGSANAGFNRLTVHSRANCLSINESISWDATSRWQLRTESHHSPHKRSNVDSHWVETSKDHEYVNTWRSAAIHYGEAWKDWHVYGSHWVLLRGEEKIFATTEADNCNIYDGWWDKDHPEWRS